MTELTIVMPCLNEAETLAVCIRAARGYLERRGVDGEVVIGDNGSTDGSQAIAEAEGARVVAVPERGYGAALHHAIIAARGRFVVMGDSDDSYDFSQLDAFLDRLRAGDDLVMGNRFQGGIKPGAMPWKNRYIGNPILTGIGRWWFACPARDFHCGLRAFSRAAYLRMDLRTTGMEFASEMVIKATLLGMRISEVPTVLRKDGRSRPPHLRPWRDGWRHLRFMALFSPRWLLTYPGLLLLLLGAGGVAWLLPGPRALGGLTIDIHTYVAAIGAALLGWSMLLTSLLARAFGVREGLFPRPSWLLRLERLPLLEAAALAGVALMLVGVGLGWHSWRTWHASGYGQLAGTTLVRLLGLGVLVGLAGAQLLLTSFLWGALHLPVRRTVS